MALMCMRRTGHYASGRLDMELQTMLEVVQGM